MARRVRVPLLGVALLAIACGGDAPPDASPATGTDAAASTETGPLDACALLTREQVADVLGGEPGDAIVGLDESRGDEGVQASRCSWPAASSGHTLSLRIRRAAADGDVESAITGIRETLRSAGEAVEDVEGVADAAFWTGTELHVVRGPRDHLVLGLTGFDDPAAALAAARRAAAHIGVGG